MLLLTLSCAPQGGTTEGSELSGSTGTADSRTTSFNTNSEGSEASSSTRGWSTGTSTGGGRLSYASEVYPVWVANCSCHITEFKVNANVPILDPDTSYTSLLEESAWQVPSMKYIVAGDLEGSYLWHKIAGTAGDVGTFEARMPLLGGDLSPTDYLSEEELDLISAWILGGAAP